MYRNAIQIKDHQARKMFDQGNQIALTENFDFKPDNNLTYANQRL